MTTRRIRTRDFFSKPKKWSIGAAAHIFKNSQTQKVATEIDLNGTLKSPDVSSWQAFVEVVRNAFIQAILSGL